MIAELHGQYTYWRRVLDVIGREEIELKMNTTRDDKAPRPLHRCDLSEEFVRDLQRLVAAFEAFEGWQGNK